MLPGRRRPSSASPNMFIRAPALGQRRPARLVRVTTSTQQLRPDPNLTLKRPPN